MLLNKEKEEEEPPRSPPPPPPSAWVGLIAHRAFPPSPPPPPPPCTKVYETAHKYKILSLPRRFHLILACAIFIWYNLL